MDIQVIVNQMIILFLVMIIGYIANKSGILDQTQNQKMSSLVLNITSPGLILSSVRAPTNGSLSSVIQIFLISIAIYMVLPIMGILLSRILKVPKEDRNLYQFMTIFSNFLRSDCIMSSEYPGGYLLAIITSFLACLISCSMSGSISCRSNTTSPDSVPV